MPRPHPDAPRGILKPGVISDHTAYRRYAPAPGLEPYIAHFWSVSWDLRGQPPFTAETLPHPSVHLIFERGRGQVAGVQTGIFRRRLQGKGRVFGVKFRPAAFRPVLGAPLSRITDRTLGLRTVFGRESDAFKDAILADADPERCAELAERFLEERLPPLPAKLARLRDLVEWLATDQTVTQVAQVVAKSGIELRKLQREFKAGVGVSPKWVIQRYRLHEVAMQLSRPGAPDMAALAQGLGYFDQAHFVRDFKAVVGHPPGHYAAKAGTGRG